jgi:hypothetical protein
VFWIIPYTIGQPWGGGDFWVFLGGIWLIFVGRGGNFEFLRGLQQVGLF